MSDQTTHETNVAWRYPASFGSNEKVVHISVAKKLERERDEAREALSEIAFYLSMGMGDETTTAEQYKQRIQEGIKMLTEPIVNLWKQAESERDEARAAKQLLRKKNA